MGSAGTINLLSELTGFLNEQSLNYADCTMDSKGPPA